MCGVVCGVLFLLRAGGVLFKTRTQYRGVLGKRQKAKRHRQKAKGKRQKGTGKETKARSPDFILPKIGSRAAQNAHNEK